MNTACINTQSGAADATPAAATSPTGGGGNARALTAPASSTATSDAEIVQLADNLAKQLLECLAYSTGWLLKAGQIIRNYQRQTSHGQMTAVYNSGRLPWGQRYCQVLSVIARNTALADPKVLQALPSSIAALEVISTHLNGEMIQDGVQSGMLHPKLTREGARAAAHKLRTQALFKNPLRPLP